MPKINLQKNIVDGARRPQLVSSIYFLTFVLLALSIPYILIKLEFLKDSDIPKDPQK